MRALQVTTHGSPGEVLAINEVRGAGARSRARCSIRVAGAALNFNDIMRCRGQLVSVAKDPPFTLGMDVMRRRRGGRARAPSGWVGRVVVAVSKDALGGIAEYTVAPASGVFDAPPELDDIRGRRVPAAVPHHPPGAVPARPAGGGGDAARALRAPAGLGTAAIQLGVAAGARVIATVSSAGKAELCSSLGAELVIDHTAEDFAEAVLGATGDVGADVICDLAGGEFVPKSWQCVARDGRYLAVGFTDDDENGMTGRPLRMASIGNFSVVGVLCAWVDDLDPGMRRFGFNPFTRADGDLVHQDLLRLIAEGRIRPHVGRTVTMEEAGAALDDHEQRRSIGRTVVRVGAPA